MSVVIWTDRLAEWAQDRRRPGPRKAPIDIEGWIDQRGDQVFPVGGITTLVQAVRTVELRIEARHGQRPQEPFVVVGQVSAVTGVTPIAVHITDPDGTLHTEQTTTTAAGQLTHTTRYRPDRSLYQIQAFVLSGTMAAEAESTVIELVMP